MTSLSFPPFLIPAARRCAALLAIALAGCTTYDYVPPASEAGRQCLATCEVARQTCRAGVSQTGAQQAATTELARSNQLVTCLAGATSADDRKACQRGANNGVLLNTQQHSQPIGELQCSSTYDQCFTNCGGQIIERRGDARTGQDPAGLAGSGRGWLVHVVHMKKGRHDRRPLS